MRWAPAVDRFWGCVDRSAGPGGCWPWTGKVDDGGYGWFRHDARVDRAHRYSLVLHRGRPLDSDECVLHRCDNPPCCNPEHLWAGSRAENNQDRVKKGRDGGPRRRGLNHISVTRPESLCRGSEHVSSKLTEQDVKAIRLSRGTTQRALAVKFGVTPTLICRILKRKTWKHV